MKFTSVHSTRRLDRGFAVLVVLILLAIMMALAIGNNVALGQFRRELQLIERRQQRRLDGATANTNAAPTQAAASSPQPASRSDSRD